MDYDSLMATGHDDTKTRRLILVLCVVVTPWLVDANAQNQSAIAFVGATLVDGTGAPAIANSVVVIRGDRIVDAGPAARVAVPADARRIERAGTTILPGLINTSGRDTRRTASLRYGVTSVFGPTGGTAITLDQAKARLTTGIRFLPRAIVDRHVDVEFVQLARAADACVASLLIRELSMFVYETTPSFFREAFVLRHADPDEVAALGSREFQDSIRNNPELPRYKMAFEVASRNVKQLTDAGVRVALGTDSGAPGRFAGSFEHLELELMVRAGLTTRQAILAATGDAARCLGRAGTIGTIQPGARADLLVLDGDPLADIRNTRRIASVWASGVEVDP